MSAYTLLGTLAPVSIMVMLVVLAELSRRLGEVIKAKHIHRWFFVAAGLIFVSIIVRLLFIGSEPVYFDIETQASISLLYTGPLALGLFIGVVAAWRYWGWLIYASEYQLHERRM